MINEKDRHGSVHFEKTDQIHLDQLWREREENIRAEAQKIAKKEIEVEEIKRDFIFSFWAALLIVVGITIGVFITK